MTNGNRRSWLGVLLTALLCLALGWVANDKLGSRYVLHVPDVGRYRIDSHSGKTWRLEEKERTNVNELPAKKETPPDDLFQQWLKKNHPDAVDSTTAVAEPSSADPALDYYMEGLRKTHPGDFAPKPDKPRSVWVPIAEQEEDD